MPQSFIRDSHFWVDISYAVRNEEIDVQLRGWLQVYLLADFIFSNCVEFSCYTLLVKEDDCFCILTHTHVHIWWLSTYQTSQTSHFSIICYYLSSETNRWLVRSAFDRQTFSVYWQTNCDTSGLNFIPFYGCSLCLSPDIHKVLEVSESTLPYSNHYCYQFVQGWASNWWPHW